jgi:hypothetical protein
LGILYAGGGGGAQAGGGAQPIGGAFAGGGIGGSLTETINGTANKGGGGGGAGNGTDIPGGDGGSGVVIVRYASTFPPVLSTTGSPTITVSGGYRYYTFTSSGSLTV